jgi:threonylcarbamoyladenosine tRNA methylthiotransferase MtaB
MPQLDGGLIRDRAARLRGIGAERIARHLAEMQGRIVRLLMEKPDQGRTEGFALTRLSAQARPGEIISARITGRDAAGLLAEAA